MVSTAVTMWASWRQVVLGSTLCKRSIRGRISGMGFGSSSVVVWSLQLYSKSPISRTSDLSPVLAKVLANPTRFATHPRHVCCEYTSQSPRPTPQTHSDTRFGQPDAPSSRFWQQFRLQEAP